MKTGKLLFNTFFLFFICLAPARSQDIHRAAIEETVTEYLSQIRAKRKDTSASARDSLYAANFSLMAYLKNMCHYQPMIMREEFHKIGDIDGHLNGINILTSDDKRLRIYCWDTWTSKQLHRFNTLVQYRNNDSISLIAWADIGADRGHIGRTSSCYSEINTIYNDDDKPIYLLMSYSINEGHEGNHSVQAYTIDSTLSPISIFNNDGGATNMLRVNSDKATRGVWPDDDTNIKISADGSFLYVPILKKANAKKVRKGEKGYNIYKFDGQQFVYKKNLNN